MLNGLCGSVFKFYSESDCSCESGSLFVKKMHLIIATPLIGSTNLSPSSILTQYDSLVSYTPILKYLDSKINRAYIQN